MANQERPGLSDRAKKLLAGASIAIFVILTLSIAWFVGRPLIQYIQDPEKFRAWVDSAGHMGRIYFLGIQILQVVVAIIPGEPIEMGAGYAFGAVEGTLLCMAGTIIGSMLVYFFVRRFGVKAVEIFFPIEKIENLRFLNTAKKRDALMFLLVFIPGTPKDLLAYSAPLTGMGPWTWLFITSVARIPSVITSTIGGGALGVKNYVFAAAAIGVTLLISVIGLFIYKRICARHAAHETAEQEKAPNEQNSTGEGDRNG